MGKKPFLYLDDIMSCQLRGRAASFLRALCFVCWRLFILILTFLVLLARHQRKDQSSMEPREGAVQELLSEDGGTGEKTRRGQEMSPGVEEWKPLEKN